MRKGLTDPLPGLRLAELPEVASSQFLRETDKHPEVLGSRLCDNGSLPHAQSCEGGRLAGAAWAAGQGRTEEVGVACIGADWLCKDAWVPMGQVSGPEDCQA